MPQVNLPEWRKKKSEGEWRELPSGLRVRIRRLSLLQMAASGSIPTNLVGQVDTLLNKTISPREAVEKCAGAIDAHIMRAVLEPVIVPAGDPIPEGGICIDELDVDDKLATFNWLNSSPATLLSFLETETK
jgi:hypothetical protein